MKHLPWTRLSIACATAALVSACGGGGGDGLISEASASPSDANVEAQAATTTRLPALRINSDDETVTCANRSIGAVSLDTVYVADGTTCQLFGTLLKGSIKVGSNATLLADAVRVNGDLQAEGSRSVTVRGSSTFGGSVQIKQGGGASITGARITGDLQFDQMRLALVATSNRVNGNLQAVGNRGGVRLVNNVMDGNLQCKENVPAPTGSGNRAASKEDQCKRL